MRNLYVEPFFTFVRQLMGKGTEEMVELPEEMRPEEFGDWDAAVDGVASAYGLDAQSAAAKANQLAAAYLDLKAAQARERGA